MSTTTTPARPGPDARPGAASPSGAAARVGASAGRTVFPILFTISACHMINDTLQAVLPAVYPILARSFRLSYGQIGVITLVFQFTSSLLQPLIGAATDRRPRPWSLPVGMACTLVGLLLLSRAPTYGVILLAAGLVGLGSAIFHPDGSRVARLASGGRYGMAQSLFQVGGNTGTSFGPLLAAFIVLPFGQHAIALFAVIALLGVVLLTRVSAWYGANVAPRGTPRAVATHGFSNRHVALAITVLVVLVFSKVVYLSSLTNYYMFYLMHRFGLSVYSAQLHLFLFLGAVAAGTYAGGPIGDRIGRRRSDLGVHPGHAAVLAAAAACGARGDHRAQRPDRPDPVVGVLGDRGVRPGAAARPCRRRGGPVLRALVRARRHRRRGSRPAGRPRRPRHGLPGLRVPPRDRTAGRVPAAHGCPRMSTRVLATALALAAIGAAPAARADVKVDGAVFPDTLATGGHTLVRNGVGVRVFFHIVDGYVTALYLGQPAHTAADVMAGPNPKAVVTTFLHAASLGQVRDETETIHRRFCAHNTCSAADQASYAIFLAHLAPAHAGETELVVVTDAGVEVHRDGREIVTIPDAAFGQNMIRSLLGDAAPTGRYRRGLLGVTG